MKTQNEYIFKKEGDDKYKMSIKGKKNIFGIIEKEYSEKRTKEAYSIKYFWNKVFQDKKYADTLDEAKEKLKHILLNVEKQVTEIQYERKNIMTFESFIGGETMRNNNSISKEWNEEETYEIENLGFKLNKDDEYVYKNQIHIIEVSKEMVSHRGYSQTFYLMSIKYTPMRDEIFKNSHLFKNATLNFLDPKVKSIDTLDNLIDELIIHIDEYDKITMKPAKYKYRKNKPGVSGLSNES